VPHFSSWKPCYLTKVPDGPQTYVLNILWLQKKGALTYLSGSPAKGPSPEAHRTEPLQRDMLHSYSPLHPSVKVPGRRAAFQVPPTGPLWKQTPVSRALSTYPSGSPATEPSLITTPPMLLYPFLCLLYTIPRAISTI
jgi:hypothetical protein